MKNGILLSAVASIVLAGCFSNSVNPSLVQAKAASDFECKSDKVSVSQVNDNNWKAKGCGKKATYVCSGANFMHDGTCMREGSLP